MKEQPLHRDLLKCIKNEGRKQKQAGKVLIRIDFSSEGSPIDPSAQGAPGADSSPLNVPIVLCSSQLHRRAVCTKELAPAAVRDAVAASRKHPKNCVLPP
jgi:hypothetical protein